MSSISLYVHIPFCRAKCAYCDFNSYAGLEHLFGDYVQALVHEIELVGQALNLEARTVYIGGGTPTVLSLDQLVSIMVACRRSFLPVNDIEITIEANPGTVDGDYLAGLLDLGINRLSLGVQSFNDQELCLLGRIHTAAEAIESYRLARKVGFTNINLDLIYGIPYQTLDHWREALRQALDLGPNHLSLYALTLEEHTPLAQRVACGEVPAPDDDLAADMYILVEEMLAEEGYVHYEISNWARLKAESWKLETSIRHPAFSFQYPVCRHNLTYWHNEPYLGFGAGAHSYFDGRRYYNVLHPAGYIERLSKGKSPVAESEEISRDLEMAETMILGLRLVEEGVRFSDFEGRFGRELHEVYGKEVEELRELGLIEVDDERVRLTARGRLLGNEVFERFLP